MWRLVIISILLLVASPGEAQERRITRADASDPGPELRLEETLRIGSLEGEDDTFGRVMDAKFDGSGRIFVADDLSRQVTVYRGDGRLVGVLGRRGQGPGEFLSPWKIAIDAADSIFVWDFGLARVSVFSPDLKFARDFRVPPEWLINSVEFLSDGSLLIAAFGPDVPGGLHLVDRDGTVQRTFASIVPPRDNLGGYESSLLGGTAAAAGGLLGYSSKSPYTIAFYDPDGTLRTRCVGEASWTTDPGEVVVQNDQGAGLRWNRYVHSSALLHLAGNLWLNVIHDPVASERTIDIITPGCALLRRSRIDQPLTLTDRSGQHLLGVRNLDFPEIVVYRFELSNGTGQSP